MAQIADTDAEIGPVSTSAGGGKHEPKLDRLSNIVAIFNDKLGSIASDAEYRIRRIVTEELHKRPRSYISVCLLTRRTAIRG
jgi:type I restriction enzyme R subunit